MSPVVVFGKVEAWHEYYYRGAGVGRLCKQRWLAGKTKSPSVAFFFFLKKDVIS